VAVCLGYASRFIPSGAMDLVMMPMSAVCMYVLSDSLPFEVQEWDLHEQVELRTARQVTSNHCMQYSHHT